MQSKYKIPHGHHSAWLKYPLRRLKRYNALLSDTRIANFKACCSQTTLKSLSNIHLPESFEGMVIPGYITH